MTGQHEPRLIGPRVVGDELLPSATVFLLLLCNDRAVLGPWVNSRWLNLFTGAVIAVLVMLSLILTLSVLFPGITEKEIVGILIGGSIVAIIAAVGVKLIEPTKAIQDNVATTEQHNRERGLWRMPPLNELPPARLTPLRIVQLAMGGA